MKSRQKQNENEIFLCPGSDPDHTMPEKFQNAALIIWLVSSNVHTNPSRKRSSKWRNLNTPALRFSVKEETLKTVLFENEIRL